MMIILRWIINALALLAAAAIVPGFHIESFYTALIAALILGLINALVRPIILILTLPITIITLGLSVFLVNTLMFWLMSTMVKGVAIDGFWPAVATTIFLWAVGVVSNRFIKYAKKS
jgi:putative membrane protein